MSDGSFFRERLSSEREACTQCSQLTSLASLKHSDFNLYGGVAAKIEKQAPCMGESSEKLIQ